MSGFEDFLGGFFGTGSKIVQEKKKERRKAKREDDLRAQRNADELNLYTKKLELETKSKIDIASAKAKKEKEEIEAWNESLNIALSTNGDTTSSGGEALSLSSVDNVLDMAYAQKAPKNVIDRLEHKRKVLEEFKEEKNKPVGSLIDRDTLRQFNDMWSVTTEDKTKLSPSPLFPEGKKIPQVISLADAKRKNLIIEGRDTKNIIVEGNLVTHLVEPTANNARREILQSESRAQSIAIHIGKEKGSTIGPREIDQAGKMEKALNALDLATTDEEKIAAVKEFSSLYKEALGDTPIKLSGQVPIFLNSERQRKIKEAKELLASKTEDVATPLTDKLDVGREEDSLATDRQRRIQKAFQRAKELGYTDEQIREMFKNR